MELVASIEGHRERLLAALAERYGPRLRDGEILPDWGLELELTVRDVLAALKRLVELDDQVDRRSSEHETLRLRRDRLVGDDIYPRRRLARRAREARESRAAATAAAPEAMPQPGEESETARAPVPQKLADWLEKRLRFGT